MHEEHVMRASAGDRIILAGALVDQPTRSGEVLETGPDGGPPYVVRWEDGHTSSMFPGPGVLLKVLTGDAEQPDEAAAPQPQQTGQVRQWTVRVTVFEEGDDTRATVALVADDPETLTARGSSHRGRHDPDNPHIGDEVAVARALRRLADQLLESAEHEIEDATGERDVMVRAR
jgi:Domain of unknown function (DUF1876)/Domain of unknown function (DUF1918)